MPAININDLNNAQLDAYTIASVANSSARTVIDRLGNSKYTLSGINAAMLASAAATQGSIGYLPPVAYAVGISLTLAAQTVGYSGQTYAPILSTLPFTTSGTFETAKFRLIQGVSGADLAAPSGAALVGYDNGTAQDVFDSAKPMANYAALRTYTGRATGVRITAAGIAGFFQLSALDTTSADNGGTIIVDVSGRRWLRLFSGALYVKWFGATGDGVTDDAPRIQAAVNVMGTLQGHLIFSAGTYRLSVSITFPNTAFLITGEGITSTAIRAMVATPAINLFDFSGCNGPAKTMRGISFQGPVDGQYGTGAAIKCVGTNGLYLDNVWVRGIHRAISVSASSLINTNQCVAEYCYIACEVLDALPESIWQGWTFYRNETDLQIAGAQSTFEINSLNAVGTNTNVLLITGGGMVVRGLTVKNDGTVNTPNIINLTGANNLISDIKIFNYGLNGIFFQGAGAINNRISGMQIEGVPTAINASACSGNSVSNFTIKGSTTRAVRLDNANENNFSDFTIDGCAVGVSLNATDLNAFRDGIIKNSVTADWDQTAANTGRLIVDNVRANFAGIANIPYLLRIMPSGNYSACVSAIPTLGYPFVIGDEAINKNPLTGYPTGWRCTVSGAPGTWQPFGQVGTISSIAATPFFLGQIAIVGVIAYIANGVSSPADWKALN